MIDRTGPLLQREMVRAEGMSPQFESLSMARWATDFDAVEMSVAAAHGRVSDEGQLPVVVKVASMRPEPGEQWPHFRDRVGEVLENVHDLLKARVGISGSEPSFAANSLATALSPEQVAALGDDPEITVELVELDPLVEVATMDDVSVMLERAPFVLRHPDLDGAGVRVAVLDSGIDLDHPDLQVTDSVSTCGEPVDIPGSHGTHVAGAIASRDLVFAGIAPGVELVNVKVLRANGTGQHTFITRGVDEALNRDCHILSLSLGFNHLPVSSSRGHGWTCPDGRCTLCLAVDNAVDQGAVVVVAAGNDHQRAEALGPGGPGGPYDTELACPGQARRAITVGAIEKGVFQIAAFSSRGPTAYGEHKPDVSAPGVNITSTIPVPRDASGQPSDTSRSLRFGRKSGTSMATPIVSGVVALLIQRAMEHDEGVMPDEVLRQLLADALGPDTGPPDTVGHGRVTLARL